MPINKPIRELNTNDCRDGKKLKQYFYINMSNINNFFSVLDDFQKGRPLYERTCLNSFLRTKFLLTN